MASQVWVVGSAILDIVQSVEKLPQPGESVFSRKTDRYLGGKGANQALAAARMGAKVLFCGAVGADEPGKEFQASLSSAGIDIEHLMMLDSDQTGAATILVDPTGMNMIAVNIGANEHLDPLKVQALPIEEGDIVLCQMETNENVLLAAAQHAKLILNPAPAAEVPYEILRRTWILIPNETETEMITGVNPVDDNACRQAANRLLEEGIENVIITLGERGAFWMNQMGHNRFSAPSVEAVDCTGAGDVFCGTLAAELSQGKGFPSAIKAAVAAASMSTTKHGAIPSIPTKREVAKFYEKK